MKNIIVLTLFFGASLFSNTAFASDNISSLDVGIVATEQTAKYSIEHMTCITCPFTVRKAMENVEGVIKVTVDFNSKTAVVVFNPQIASVEKIGSASTNAGYKATSI